MFKVLNLHRKLLLIYNTIQKFGVSILIFLREINTFIQQGCIKLIKSDSKDIYVIKYIKKLCYFELSIHHQNKTFYSNIK